MNFRTEKDSMGEMQVPADAYCGLYFSSLPLYIALGEFLLIEFLEVGLDCLAPNLVALGAQLCQDQVARLAHQHELVALLDDERRRRPGGLVSRRRCARLPQPLTGRCIIRINESAHSVFSARDSDDDFVLHRQRRHGEGIRSAMVGRRNVLQ